MTWAFARKLKNKNKLLPFICRSVERESVLDCRYIFFFEPLPIFFIYQAHRSHKGDFFLFFFTFSGSSMGLRMVHRVSCTGRIKEINCHNAMHSRINKANTPFCYSDITLLYVWSFALACISYMHSKTTRLSRNIFLLFRSMPKYLYFIYFFFYRTQYLNFRYYQKVLIKNSNSK